MNDPIIQPAPSATPIIPDHELVRRIGEGAFGEVWLARSQATGRFRAVKIVYRERFKDDRPYETEFAGLKKFEAISREHEGFVDILHISRSDSHRYFAGVMELADDLETGPQVNPDTYTPRTVAKELTQRPRLAPAECVRLGLALVEAISELHRRGLVHRDIKPANIIFVRGAPKLADVGLVTEVKGHLEPRTMIGTPEYIDPFTHGTAQGDLYGLGKVLYVMATGCPAIQWPTWPEDADHIEDLHAFRGLDEIFRRACDPDLKQRYQDAEEMRRELVLLQAGHSMHRLRQLERVIKTVKRYAIAGALVLLLAVLAVFQWNRQKKQADELRQRQVGSSVAYGTRALDANDLVGSLPWFTEALQLDAGDPVREETHRLRLGLVLRACPALVRILATERKMTVLFVGNDRHLLSANTNHLWTVTDLVSGQPVFPSFGSGALREVATLHQTTRLAATSAENETSVRIWDLNTGRLVRLLNCETNVVTVDTSKDGQWLSAALDDGTAVIWSLQTGERYRRLMGHQMGLQRGVFSRDGRRFVTCGSDSRAIVWDIATGGQTLVITNHTSWVMGACFSPDGRWLATSSFDRTARVWEIASGREHFPALPHGDCVLTVDFSADGERLLTACNDYSIRLWNAHTGQLLQYLRHTAKVRRAIFSPSGEHIVTACHDGTIRVWDIKESEATVEPQPVVFARDGHHWGRLADNAIHLMKSSNQVAQIGLGVEGRPLNIALSADGAKGLVIMAAPEAKAGTQVRGFDARSSQLTGEAFVFQGHTNIILSPDGNSVAVHQESRAGVWDIKSGRQILTLPKTTTRLAFDHRSTRIAVAETEVARIWSLSTGNPLPTPALSHSNEVVSLEWSQDGRFLLAACAIKNIDADAAYLWDTETGRLAAPHLTHRDGVLHATFSHDGRRILTCGEDFQAIIWDSATGRIVVPPLQHPHQVAYGAFSSNDRWIATACADGTARIWDAATGEPLGPPFLHPAVSPDNRRRPGGSMDGINYVQWVQGDQALVSRTRSGTTRVWSLPRDQRPLEDLISIAQLLSSQRTYSGETLMPETRAALVETWQRLQAKYPSEFSFRPSSP